MFATLASILIDGFAYGLVLRNWVLISANIVAMLGSGAVVAGKLMYGV